MNTFYNPTEEYISHHGVIGQKWGIRRYQNYDGTYTQKGMERYHKSMDKWNEEKQKTAVAKSRYKNGEITKDAYKTQKAKTRQAERQVDKDYKHLKLDKLGDKGKIRYANGERITMNQKVNRGIRTAGFIATAIGFSAAQQGTLDRKTTMRLYQAGALLTGGSYIKQLIDNKHDNELRAYYAHTSKY